MKEVYFIIPEFDHSITGGTLYDNNLVLELRKHHISIKEVRVHYKINTILLHKKINKIPKRSVILIDGYLVNKIRTRVTNRLNILIHHPCSMEISNNKMSNINLYLTERKAFNAAESLITVSKTMKKVLLKYLDGYKKICVAYPGIDKIFYKQEINKDSKNILSVGNVIPRKGYHILIEALHRVTEDWRLTIVGNYEMDKTYYDNLKRLIIKNKMQDRIEFKGSMKPIEIISEIKKSKFFILLTKYEGFGMSIAECAAAGLEIITTDLPVLREVLGNYSVDFVDLKDIDNIGRKINEKLSRNSVNAKNEDIIYNWSRTAKKIKRSL